MFKYLLIAALIFAPLGLGGYYLAKHTATTDEQSSTKEKPDLRPAPTGMPISNSEIQKLAGFFTDEPLTGGQKSRRKYKWVGRDSFMFIEFDSTNIKKAKTITHIGIGVKGVFCAETQPDKVGKSFSHFQKWSAQTDSDGYGSTAGDIGYWMSAIRTGAVPNTTPGINYEYEPTPVPECGDTVPQQNVGINGTPLTKLDLASLASLFNDKTLFGGQLSPRLTKWVSENTYIFLQYDDPVMIEASSLSYIGIGKRGTLCKEDRGSDDFSYFHKWSTNDYLKGRGSIPNDSGYWLMFMSVQPFQLLDRLVPPGLDKEYARLEPPTCSGVTQPTGARVQEPAPINSSQTGPLSIQSREKKERVNTRIKEFGGEKIMVDLKETATESATSVTTIAVTGSEFQFNPSTITVNVNQPVVIKYTNTGKIPHSFTIPSLGISSEPVPSGQTKEISFTAPATPNASGYDIVCAESGHKDAGEVGKLIVQ